MVQNSTIRESINGENSSIISGEGVQKGLSPLRGSNIGNSPLKLHSTFHKTSYPTSTGMGFHQRAQSSIEEHVVSDLTALTATKMISYNPVKGGLSNVHQAIKKCKTSKQGSPHRATIQS